LLRARRDLLRLPARFEFAPKDGRRWSASLPAGGEYLKESLPAGSSWSGYPVRRGVEEGKEWFRFYPRLGEGDLRDPWAESVVVAGEPEELARRAELRARRLEGVSLLLFLAAVLINGYLAFLALSYLL
jgi:hypothetical protein